MSERNEKLNPYEAPGVDDAQESLTVAESTYQAGYVSQKQLLFGLLGILVFQAVLSLLNGAACLALNYGSFGDGQDAQLVEWSGRFAEATNIAYYLTILPFGAFLIRANKNASAVGRVAPSFSANSMVWWFAVPILNLIRPYQAVREVWDSSTPEGRDSFLDQGAVVRFWWGAWLCRVVLWRIVGILSRGADQETANLIVAAGSFAEVIACSAAMAMLNGLHRRQEQCAVQFAA